MSTVVSFPALGWEFTVSRVAFSIGGIPVYWYGIIIAAGLFLAVLFVLRHTAEFGIDSDRMIDVVCVGTVMAIVCARVYYVAMAPFSYSSVWEMLDIRKGGIAIYGALFGAFVFGGLACRWRHVPVLPMFDLAAMGFLIGQCIGRWGNFVNQEAFGCNTTLPWGMYSEKTQEYLESSVVTVPPGVTIDAGAPVHPTFLYESLWCLIGFVLLARYFKKRRFDGDVALRYAIWYGLGRFWIEGLRTDSLLLVPSLGLRASQLVAAVTVLVSLALEFWLRRRYRGRPLRVALAVTSENLRLRRQAEKDGLTPADAPESTLPADAPRAAFLRAAAAYNEALGSALRAQRQTAEKKGNGDGAKPQKAGPQQQ